MRTPETKGLKTTNNPIDLRSQCFAKRKGKEYLFLPVPDSFHRSYQEYCSTDFVTRIVIFLEAFYR